jgi:hypothetical protein
MVGNSADRNKSVRTEIYAVRNCITPRNLAGDLDDIPSYVIARIEGNPIVGRCIIACV